MTRSAVRSVGALALALGLAATLSGCGSSGSNSAASKQAQNDINKAADASMRQGSAQIAMNTTTTIGTQKSGTEAAGVVAFDGSVGNLLLLLPASNTRIEEHVSNGIIYLKLSAPNVPKSVTSKWIKVSLSDTATLQKLGVSGLPPVGQILAQLKSLGGTAVNSGKVSLANKVFTKYVVTVSLAELISKATTLYGPTSNSVAALKAAPSDTHATIEIYVNTSGLVSREVETLGLPVSGKTTQTTTDIALANYGTPISTATPPAKDVVDASALLKSTGGATGSG